MQRTSRNVAAKCLGHPGSGTPRTGNNLDRHGGLDPGFVRATKPTRLVRTVQRTSRNAAAECLGHPGSGTPRKGNSLSRRGGVDPRWCPNDQTDTAGADFATHVTERGCEIPGTPRIGDAPNRKQPRPTRRVGSEIVSKRPNRHGWCGLRNTRHVTWLQNTWDTQDRGRPETETASTDTAGWIRDVVRTTKPTRLARTPQYTSRNVATEDLGHPGPGTPRKRRHSPKGKDV